MCDLIGVDRALVIDQPYIGRTLKGLKPLEMRSQNTNIREKIGLIEKGSGHIVATANLVSSSEYSIEELKTQKLIDQHTLDYNDVSLWRWRFGWKLENIKVFESPVKYNHPMGAVIWVRSGAWE